MQYLILIYASESAWTSIPEPALKEMYAAYGKYTQDLLSAGVMRAGSELQPTSTATTVRVREGRTVMTDGPFAETKEQLGGYYLIEVASLDEATKWAAQCPSAPYGSIEVRPVAPSTAG